MKKLLFALLILGCLTSTAQADPLDPFGASVRRAGAPAQQVHLQATLDGDSSKDDVFLVEILSAPPAGVKVLNALSSSLKGGPAKGELAVAIILHPQGKSVAYLIRGGDFFRTPNWKEGHYKGMIKVKHGPQPPKDAKGQSIAVFTESGADYYLHWNGKTFMATSQGDQP